LGVDGPAARSDESGRWPSRTTTSSPSIVRDFLGKYPEVDVRLLLLDRVVSLVDGERQRPRVRNGTRSGAT
jgi:hypothetical protein